MFGNIIILKTVIVYYTNQDINELNNYNVTIERSNIRYVTHVNLK